MTAFRELQPAQRLWLRVVASLCLVLCSAAAPAQYQSAPAPVRVALAQRASMAATVVVPGTVVSRRDARIAAEVPGRLEWVADVGSKLAAGEVVARIEATRLELRRRELEAQAVREQARLGFLEQEQRRLEELAERNVAALNQLDQTRSQRQVAASELAMARARLEQVADEIERAQIRAPFDGVLVERLSQPGERVEIGTLVARLVAPQHLEVISRAPLEYMEFLAPGDEVPIRMGAEEIWGRVRTVVAVGDENTHLFELRVDVPPFAAPVGRTARVTLPASATREVLSVPRDALVLRPGGTSVFVIDGEQRARRVSVLTGLASGSRIEVQGDLAPGDRVVVRGNERLDDGQPVTILDGPAVGRAG